MLKWKVLRFIERNNETTVDEMASHLLSAGWRAKKPTQSIGMRLLRLYRQSWLQREKKYKKEIYKRAKKTSFTPIFHISRKRKIYFYSLSEKAKKYLEMMK